MQIKKVDGLYVVKINLNKNNAVIAKASTKEAAVDLAIKQMTKRINSLEKEVKSMYDFQNYVRNVVTGGGC